MRIYPGQTLRSSSKETRIILNKAIRSRTLLASNDEQINYSRDAIWRCTKRQLSLRKSLQIYF